MPRRIQHIWSMWKWDFGMFTGGALIYMQNKIGVIVAGLAVVASAYKWWQQHKLIKMQQETERLDQEIKKKQLENH